MLNRVTNKISDLITSNLWLQNRFEDLLGYLEDHEDDIPNWIERFLQYLQWAFFACWGYVGLGVLFVWPIPPPVIMLGFFVGIAILPIRQSLTRIRHIHAELKRQ